MNFQNLKPYLPQILKSLLIAAVLVFGDFLFMWSHFENRYPRQWSATYETFGWHFFRCPIFHILELLFIQQKCIYFLLRPVRLWRRCLELVKFC